MTKNEAQKRVEKLRRLIDHHRYLYHVLDRQEISSSALDSLKKELFDLEQQYPDLITPDSPTQRVGGEPREKFQKVRHLKPMLSLNDAFTEQDMHDWLERISKLLSDEEREQLDFYCELKIDGLAVELIYRDDLLRTGSTRGDGLRGEEVTQNLKTIEAIPLRLRALPDILKDLQTQDLNQLAPLLSKRRLKQVIVRGEVFVSRREFERVNKEQQRNNLSSFANPRNMAAGSIRQLDPKVTAKRRLAFFAYDLTTDLGGLTHAKEHKLLKILGFKTNPHTKVCQDLREVFGFQQLWLKKRETLPYEIDGIVVQVNNNKLFEKLGVAGKAPRGAIAYKFPLKQATSKVEAIRVQVGRTGALTPVAILEPVEVGGVRISRATLHNEDEIKRLGIKIGDTVIVGRAGDVIPEISKVLPELRTGREQPFVFPQKCPACSSNLVKPKGEVIWRCPHPNCFAQKRKYFYHFVSRGAFDIVGLGNKIVDQLLEQGLVSDPADLFHLKEGDLLSLERFAEKSAQNLITAIKEKKRISLPRFIFALGIRNVGEQTAIDLAEHFGSLEGLEKARLEDLEELSDIGPVVAKSIYDWFNNRAHLRFLGRLKRVVEIEKVRPKKGSQTLKGKTFVLTGLLASMSREEAKAKIRELGGKVTASVSGGVDFVVIGKNPGSKYQRAKKIGLKIITEPQFKKMLP